jgi:DNA-directed RNA polymerase subunit RPC12/RpoP
MSGEKVYKCMRCGRKITRDEYETCDGLCSDCYEIEIDELDLDENQ